MQNILGVSGGLAALFIRLISRKPLICQTPYAEIHRSSAADRG